MTMAAERGCKWHFKMAQCHIEVWQQQQPIQVYIVYVCVFVYTYLCMRYCGRLCRMLS